LERTFLGLLNSDGVMGTAMPRIGPSPVHVRILRAMPKSSPAGGVTPEMT